MTPVVVAPAPPADQAAARTWDENRILALVYEVNRTAIIPETQAACDRLATREHLADPRRLIEAHGLLQRAVVRSVTRGGYVDELVGDLLGHVKNLLETYTEWVFERGRWHPYEPRTGGPQ